MSKKATKVMERYCKGYVTDEQLLKYLQLGAITQEEYDTIYAAKHSTVDEVITDAVE